MLGFDCGCCSVGDASELVLVVIVLAPDDVTVAVVVETCAAATSVPVATASYVELDLAWKVGFVRALNAEKKFAKKGRLVGILGFVYHESTVTASQAEYRSSVIGPDSNLVPVQCSVADVESRENSSGRFNRAFCILSPRSSGTTVRYFLCYLS